MQLLVLLLIILTFFKPLIGSMFFIIIVALLELWIILANITKIQVNNDNNKYTLNEIKMIERYRLFFRYPFASRIFSPVFSGIQLAVFPLVPWLLIKGLYIQAVIIGLNYFVATQLAVILNPQFFLHDNLDKGKIKKPEQVIQLTEDMNTIDSAINKMYSK
jgi:hypothetical protein